MLRELRVIYNGPRNQHEAWCPFCRRKVYTLTDERVFLLMRERNQRAHHIVPRKVAHFCRKLTDRPIIHNGGKPN